MVVDRDTHTQSLGDLLGRSAREVGLTDQRAQSGGVQGQGTVGVLGNDPVTACLQLTVRVVFRTVCGDRVGGAAAQHLLDAVRGGILGVIGELGGGELHRGHGGNRLGLGLRLARGVHGGDRFNGVGGGGVLGGLVPLVVGHGGNQQG